jgi:hypothetical protein
VLVITTALVMLYTFVTTRTVIGRQITGAAKGVFTHWQSSCHIAKFVPYRKGCAHNQARQPSNPHSV